jgi:hypothetical protein
VKGETPLHCTEVVGLRGWAQQMERLKERFALSQELRDHWQRKPPEVEGSGCAGVGVEGGPHSS